MKLSQISNLKGIIERSYLEPEIDGKTLDVLWNDIYQFNKKLSFNERWEAFLSILYFLLKNDLIKLAAPFDDAQKKEMIWEGGPEILDQMNIYFQEHKTILKKNPIIFFFKFEYMFMVWQIPYPINWSKYKLD